MARRRETEEHENHERWLVSYADFITLLFAFFVVMYSISQVNSGKYRVLSNALESAFRRIPGSGGSRLIISPHTATMIPAPPMVKHPQQPKANEGKSKRQGEISKMESQLKQALAPLVKSGQVQVTEGAQGITVQINASVLFAPGNAHIGAAAMGALTAVAKILAPTDFPIKVDGYTDNTPISTPQYPSNWELSAARASSVVRLFIANGVGPSRLTATGYADQHPIASNATAAGRARNRRVAITIESKTPDVATDVPALVKLP